MARNSRKEAQRYVCQNRKARRDYTIEETFEAGLVLLGSEVKSLREGRAHLNDAYAAVANGELWLRNCHIGEYANAAQQNHEPLRERKLLLRRRELKRLIGRIEERGFTLIPLALYFNDRGFAKAELGLGKGRRHYDKREAEANRDAQREIERALKQRR